MKQFFNRMKMSRFLVKQLDQDHFSGDKFLY